MYCHIFVQLHHRSCSYTTRKMFTELLETTKIFNGNNELVLNYRLTTPSCDSALYCANAYSSTK